MRGMRRARQGLCPGRSSRLSLIVRHDNAVREYAYDRKSPIGRLGKARDDASAQGWPSSA